MKANELRIDNLVMAPAWRSNEIHLTIVETISKGWCTINGKNSYALCINHGFVETGCTFGPCIESEVLPIQFTKEWYNKLNVEQITRLFKILPLTFDMSIGDRVTLRLTGREGDVLYNYLHQVQNVISVMSGEELIIKQ